MKKHLLLFLLFGVLNASLPAQIQFTKQTQLLTPANHYSGVAIAVTDMNGDGRDDIVRLNQGVNLNIQYQSAPGQPFIASGMTLLPGGSDAWGMCTADMNNDGFGDVLAGGYQDGVKIYTTNANGALSLMNYTQPGTFVQGVNFADVNNDGWLDAFVCHDDGVSRIFGNDGDGTFTYQPNWIDLATVPSSDNSGNYGSVWSDVDNDGDVDLYIAKCRQNVTNPADPRRINQLFLNNGDGTYTQDVNDDAGLRIGWQSWTADFGDIDNDGDFDCFITNHDASSQLLENDGSGHFSDITLDAGLMDAVQGLPIQGIFRDFDNDGFVDILVVGTEHYLFRNNGNKTFSTETNPFGSNQIESIAIGDLNSDGFQDVYAGHAEVFNQPTGIRDELWMNNGNGNHFWGLSLQGKQSNRNGVGSKIRVYSALGIQTREVRSGEGYGISNSLQIHFGLGQTTQIDSVVVNWPSGTRDVIYNPEIDQYATLHEGGCLSIAVKLQADGPTTFCSGQSVTLGTADSFSSYLWSTGDTTATITAMVAGSYNLTITNAEGCSSVSNSIVLTVDPVEIPSIEALGDTTFCAGGEVVLVCSPASAYLWSTGETTQSIAVNQSGQYTVSAQGLCSMFEAEKPIAVQVLAAPLPSVQPDTIMKGETATLVAMGDKITWYDSETGQISLTVNDTLVTPALTQNTTFWVTNTSVYGNPNHESAGMKYHQGTATSSNTYNGGLVFDCFTPCILTRAKVYATVAGERKIDLRNNNGDVLQSITLNIPKDTSFVKLNFDVPVGTDLLLTTDEAVNQTNLGTVSPQLRRSSQGCMFPYELPGVLSIKTSTFDEQRYYYFYDWEIAFYSRECTSDRVPVTVEVKANSATETPAWASALRLYPNPSAGLIRIETEGFVGGDVLVNVKNAQGQTLDARQFQAQAGNAVFEMDLSTLPRGIYWLEMTGKGGTSRQKVLLH